MEIPKIVQETVTDVDEPEPIGPSFDIEHMIGRRPWGVYTSSDDVVEYMRLIARFHGQQTQQDMQADEAAMVDEQRRRHEVMPRVDSEAIRPTTAVIRVIRKLARASF